jgi:hypothetical protein
MDKSFKAVHYPQICYMQISKLPSANSEEKLQGASHNLFRISSLYGMEISVSKAE